VTPQSHRPFSPHQAVWYAHLTEDRKCSAFLVPPPTTVPPSLCPRSRPAPSSPPQCHSRIPSPIAVSLTRHFPIYSATSAILPPRPSLFLIFPLDRRLLSNNLLTQLKDLCPWTFAPPDGFRTDFFTFPSQNTRDPLSSIRVGASNFPSIRIFLHCVS